MEFEVKQLRRPNSDELIDVATRVEFEDTAEIAFAIACVDTLRLFIELGSHDIRPELVAPALESYQRVSERLSSVMNTGIEMNQGLLPTGLLSRNNFVINGQESANAVRLCIDSVQTNPEVRSFFPEDRTDLLTLFAPED